MFAVYACTLCQGVREVMDYVFASDFSSVAFLLQVAPLLHVGVGPNQNTRWLFIQWGPMKRYSADFNTFLLCALFLRAERESTKILASVTEAAGHCDERTCDTEAVPDNMPVSSYPLVRLYSVLLNVIDMTYLRDLIPAAMKAARGKLRCQLSTAGWNSDVTNCN